MKIIKLSYPKKCSNELKIKANNAINKVKRGLLVTRKSRKHGDITVQLSITERMVISHNVAYIFSKHSDYEKYLDR